jgi:hypothetical protein
MSREWEWEKRNATVNCWNMFLINIQYNVLHVQHRSLWLWPRWDLVGTGDPWPSTSEQWAHLSNGSVCEQWPRHPTPLHILVAFPRRDRLLHSLLYPESICWRNNCQSPAEYWMVVQPQVATLLTADNRHDVQNDDDYDNFLTDRSIPCHKYSWAVDGYSASQEILYF